MLVLINLEKYWEENTVVRNLGIYIYWHNFFLTSLRNLENTLSGIKCTDYSTFPLKKWEFFSYAYILNLISCSSDNGNLVIFFTQCRNTYTQRWARSPRDSVTLSSRFYLSPVFTCSEVLPTGWKKWGPFIRTEFILE